MGDRRRPRDPRPSEDAVEDVLPLRDGLRRRAEHEHLPGLPRAPRRAAGREPDGGRVDDQARPRARLRDRRPGGLLAEELLLPGQPEGLPDLPVRPAALRRRLAGSARHRAVRDRLRPRAPRGGRGEDRPRRRRHRPEDRRRALADRLQPRRHASGRDRHGAAHPLVRAGRALPAAPPADDRRARHLGGAHGGGDAARRRQRLGPAGRVGRAAHALGAEEHELVPLHRARDRGGRARAGEALRVGRRGRAAHLRLRARHRHADAAPLEGGGGRLPLLPRAGPRARRARRGARRAAAR